MINVFSNPMPWGNHCLCKKWQKCQKQIIALLIRFLDFMLTSQVASEMSRGFIGAKTIHNEACVDVSSLTLSLLKRQEETGNKRPDCLRRTLAGTYPHCKGYVSPWGISCLSCEMTSCQGLVITVVITWQCRLGKKMCWTRFLLLCRPVWSN